MTGTVKGRESRKQEKIEIGAMPNDTEYLNKKKRVKNLFPFHFHRTRKSLTKSTIGIIISIKIG